MPTLDSELPLIIIAAIMIRGNSYEMTPGYSESKVGIILPSKLPISSKMDVLILYQVIKIQNCVNSEFYLQTSFMQVFNDCPYTNQIKLLLARF